jgi:hypothetical protein
MPGATALSVPQPQEPVTPAVPDAPVTPAVPDPGTPGQPEEPARVPTPEEPVTPAVPEPGPQEPNPGQDPAPGEGSSHTPTAGLQQKRKPGTRRRLVCGDPIQGSLITNRA